jgi:Homeodomain-like domain
MWRLSLGGREYLDQLIRKGKSSAQRLMKARILLKADVGEGGEGWSDSKIIEALGTSPSMLYRVRKQLVEKGLEAVLSRKQRATPAVPKIFDGEKEAKLIALACSKSPKGYVRWVNKRNASLMINTGKPRRQTTPALRPLRFLRTVRFANRCAGDHLFTTRQPVLSGLHRIYKLAA